MERLIALDLYNIDYTCTLYMYYTNILECVGVVVDGVRVLWYNVLHNNHMYMYMYSTSQCIMMIHCVLQVIIVTLYYSHWVNL